MADNVNITAGTGTTIAADDIGGVLHQRVKLSLGADGTANDASAGAGAVGTGTQRVTLASDDPAVASLASAVTALQILDNAISGNEIQADVLTVGGQSPAYGTGAMGATVPRFTLATDDPAVVSLAALDNAVAGNEFQCDIIAALPAGTNAIGKLAANSGVDIGDVDVTTIAGVAPAFGAGVTSATTQRVVLASDAVNSNGQAVMASSSPVVIASDQAGFPTFPAATTTGGCTIFRSIDLDETEEEVKATAGQVYGMMFSNMGTTTRFLKFYNATAANVTVGATTPVITFAIPGNADDDTSGVVSFPVPVTFSTAITVAATTGIADADTGAPGANDVIVNIFYK